MPSGYEFSGAEAENLAAELDAAIGARDRLVENAAGERMTYADGYRYAGEPVFLTEFGGIAFESEAQGAWGYNQSVKDEPEFLERFGGLIAAIRKAGYLGGFCYAQLADVEQETNGLMTADRRPKVDPETVRQIVEDDAVGNGSCL